MAGMRCAPELVTRAACKVKKHISTVGPKIRNVEKTSKVMRHKVSAMSSIVAKSGQKIDLPNLERHLDRALVATELLNGIMDDTLALLS